MAEKWTERVEIERRAKNTTLPKENEGEEEKRERVWERSEKGEVRMDMSESVSPFNKGRTKKKKNMHV